MKKTKKLLALVLAMMMAFSIMAMTAAAYDAEDEGIMPLGLIGPCDYCNAMIPIETSKVARDVEVNECEGVPIPHMHTVTTYMRSYSCPECGRSNRTANSYHECWGGQ